MPAKKLTEPKALVISRDGDIADEIRDLLIAQGFQPISAGTGNEGVEAIAHFRPKAIILYFRHESEQDTIVLRAIQDLCRAVNCAVAIISPNVKATQSLLGNKVTNNNFFKVFAHPTALSEQRPRLVAQATPA